MLSAGARSACLLLMVTLVLVGPAHLLPHRRDSRAAGRGLVQPDNVNSPAADSRLVRRSTGLQQMLSGVDPAGGDGRIVGTGCGRRGICGSDCCTVEGSVNPPPRCGNMLQFVPAAGGCVDCVIIPHSLCPTNSFALFAAGGGSVRR